MILRCPQFTCRDINKPLIFWAKSQFGKATGTLSSISPNCLELSTSPCFGTLPNVLALILVCKSWVSFISFHLQYFVFHLLCTPLLSLLIVSSSSENSQQKQCLISGSAVVTSPRNMVQSHGPGHWDPSLPHQGSNILSSAHTFWTCHCFCQKSFIFTAEELRKNKRGSR